MGDGKVRCSSCRYRWFHNRLPLRLSRKQWRAVLRWFLREQSASAIAEETGIERRRVIRALMYVRQTMALDMPEVFSGIVEVDETYIGGQWKNKRKCIRDRGTKRGRGTSKQPAFGIYCRSGKVWAEIVDDVEAESLMPLIEEQVTKGSVICSDTWRAYTGIAAKGYVHRLVKHSEGEYSNRKGTHINGLEGFWGYLKRKLAAKGGIRRERLPLYLAEYVWRFNHRDLNVEEKTRVLVKRLRRVN